MKQGINIIPVKYYGYLQGFKVIFRHKNKQVKYPNKHGHCFTTLSEIVARGRGIKHLINDHGVNSEFYLTYLLKG